MIVAAFTIVYLLIGAVGGYILSKYEEDLDEFVSYFVEELGEQYQALIMVCTALIISIGWGPSLIYGIYLGMKEKSAK